MTTPDNDTFRQRADKDKGVVALSSVLAAIFLTAMKLVIGLMTGSLGILSEAAHSGLDLVAAAMTFFAVRVSGRPADREHSYGHGKIENLSALFETLLLLVTCLWIIYEAIQRLFFKHVQVEVSIWSFIVMGIAIAIDFTRSRALARVAKKYDSQALEADALHFSTDIWSSAVVIIGLLLVRLSDWLSIPWLSQADAVAAVGVAGIVVYVSVQLGSRAVGALLDAVPGEVRDSVLAAVDALPGVLEVKQVRVRRSGPETFADVTLTVSRELPLERAHEIATAAEMAVRKQMPGADVVVHVDPVRTGDEGVIETVRLAAARQGLLVHDIHVFDVLGSRRLELHVEMNDSLQVGEAHAQVSALETALTQALPGISRILTHIEPLREEEEAEARRASRVDEARVMGALSKLTQATGHDCRPHSVTIDRLDGQLAVSFHCVVSETVAIGDAHSLTEQLELALRRDVPNLGRVTIHVEPPGAQA
jgi:cation diffusion facilitator family transporter